jgi:predicted amidohydrolase
MRVALGQFRAGRDKEANLERMVALAAQAGAAGADLVLFPESAMVMAAPDESLVPWAEPLDGPFVARLAAVARRHGLAVAAGMFEPVPGEDRVYNTVVVVGRDGAVVGSYRKIHLYDAFGRRESDRVAPGDGRTLVFTHAGVTCGVATCYDVRFPELMRRLVDRGAEAVLLPAAWVHGLLKEDHWDVLVRARAIENTVYVAAADQVGGPSSGRSMLVDPMGVAVAAIGEAEGLVVGEIDPERVRQARRVNPSLANRRPEVYAAWAAPVAVDVGSADPR